jgi:citrate lyase subunit beta/citryl-CoA lyase
VVTGWLADVAFGRQERVVRMNPLDSPWGRADLEQTMEVAPDAYLVPKLRSRDDVLQIDRLLGELEARHGHTPGQVKLLLLGTETPQGALNIGTLCASPRVDALSWGAEDLSAAIGARRNRDERGEFLEVFRYCRSLTLLAACAADVQPLDTVFVDVRDEEGLRRDCQEGAWMGFTGKITIHPAQIPVVNDAFTPSPEEIAESRELLQAFEENQREGRMAFSFRGQMVDVPHLERARTLLERARQAEVSSS